jgi:putative transposase
MGGRPSRHRIASGNPWSAGCSETGTSGAEGGPGNQTGRDPGTAPRSDPYTKLLGPATWTSYYLYVILDVFSRYVVGWTVAHAEQAALAERLLAETTAKQQILPGTLTVHADRGSSMTSKPVAFLLADLGVTKTHSRPHVSNDNPYSEAQFKTLKYRPGFPDRFGSIHDARAFCQQFFGWYNAEHRHSGIAMMTPEAIHHGHAAHFHQARAQVLAAAYATHPERFVHRPPAPNPLPTAVWINPPESTQETTQLLKSTEVAGYSNHA